MNPTEDLAESLQQWLRKGGYPLEMRVSRAIRKYGGFADQSRTFTDPEEEKLREIDVVAYFDRKPGPNLHLVIECKSARDKPWVVFCTEHSSVMAHGAVSMMPATSAITEFLRTIARDPTLVSLAPFDAGNLTGYAAATGFRKPGEGRDPAFAALHSVVAAAEATAERIGRAGHHVIFPPVVVVDVPIFTCHLPDDSADPILQPVDHVLCWQPTRTSKRPVNVVKENALERLLADTSQAADRLLTLWHQSGSPDREAT